jgi:hypothetical protein
LWGRGVRLRHVAVAAISILCSGCASPFFFHDPQLGWVTAEQVPDVIKSVRCELVTYYEANRLRRQNFIAQIKNPGGDTSQNFKLAVKKFSYFDVDDGQYGTIYLDLKVIDTIGTGSGTAFDNKLIRSSEATRVFHLGPTLQDQNTYELFWNFAIRQDAHLSPSVSNAQSYAENETDQFACFNNLNVSREDMARNNVPSGIAQFKRIWVNGSEPLAAWLLDNNHTIGSSYFTETDSEAAEQIIPAQMFYNFAIQTSAGLDSKISITGLRWNPAAVEATASSQQTSSLTFYVNGPKAQLANGAKGGTATIKTAQPKPIHVIIDRPKGGIGQQGVEKRFEELAPAPSPKPVIKRKKATRSVPSYLLDKSRGQLLSPFVISPPAPSQ